MLLLYLMYENRCSAIVDQKRSATHFSNSRNKTRTFIISMSQEPENPYPRYLNNVRYLDGTPLHTLDVCLPRPTNPYDASEFWVM